MKLLIQMLTLSATLITVAFAQPIEARQPDEIRALVDEMLLTFKDFEACVLRKSQTGSTSEEDLEEEKLETETVSDYVKSMEALDPCDKNARNYLSAISKVSPVKFNLLSWRGNLYGIDISGRDCVGITDDLRGSLDTLVSVLQQEANFASLPGCGILVDPDIPESALYIVKESSGLHLRKAPRINSQSLCLLPLNSLLFDNRNKWGAWYEVIYRPVRPDQDRCPNSGQAITGWVHSEFLSPIQ